MIIGTSDLPPSDDATEIQKLITSLQAAFGSKNGLGKWTHIPLRADLLRTDNGSPWSFGASANADIAYMLIGSTMTVAFNIGYGAYSVLSAACAILKLKIPDGFKAVAPQAGTVIPMRNPIYLIDVGAGFDGMGICAAMDDHLDIYKPAGVGFTGPNIQVSGQISFECAKV